MLLAMFRLMLPVRFEICWEINRPPPPTNALKTSVDKGKSAKTLLGTALCWCLLGLAPIAVNAHMP
jgi:hypothetical protein